MPQNNSKKTKKLVRITTVPISLDKLLGEQLSYMNQFYDVTAVSADEQELKKVAEKYGVRYFHVELTRAITPLQDLKALWKLYRFLKKENPEMVHTHTPKAGLIGMMAAYFAKVPIKMHTVAGLPLLEATGIKRKILNFTEKLTYRFADRVFPNSFVMKEIILKERFCSPKKLEVIGNGSSNGINLHYFSPNSISEETQISLKKKLNISETDFVFVFVGRLVKDKGINELVSAFQNLNSKIAQPSNSPTLQLSNPPTLKLLLVGPFEHELDALLPETIWEIEKNPNIISVGFQQDVRPYFSVSDALVFPSYREGFPNVVLQALAMELPAIVTDINGCNEIVENNKNGIIIPPKNIHQLESAMNQLLQGQTFYKNLKSNSRNSILKYDREAIWEALRAEYDSCSEWVNK